MTTTALQLAKDSAKQHTADARYHRIRGQKALAAHCSQDALLLDRIAQLIEGETK